jgi:hypothetical protein
MMRTALAMLAGLVMSIGIVGCGERSQVVEYKAGHYQGKQDTQPWANPTYNGDKAKWENDIKSRSQAQNEYRRVN